ncbi:ABC transporter permease [Arthrobacter sp. MYb227]|uniref:FtsX-like permease family protein n=1 Tax=Arthrobacter sp. MYb227 TaxID=1848601 RepID=UPI000CFCBFBF|nr:FtsX-like permease family protein [Arthrobacter sp. MYb227]PQZ96351.1 ABC transporter permease [Arthrobacter sp. MYb227]
MIRLVLADIRMQASMWLWALLCAVVGAACVAGSLIAMFTSISAAQSAGDSRVVSASIALGGNIVFFTVIAAMGIISSTVGLTLTTQRREHALWVILGIPRHRVKAILRIELIVLGLVAGTLAIAPAYLVAGITLKQWAVTGLDLNNASVAFHAWHVCISLLAGIIPCVLGGWGVSARAARTPEMRAFRDATDSAAKPGIARSIFALCLLAGVVGMWIPGLGLELVGGLAQRTAFAFAGNLFLICLLLLMGPWVLTPLMKLWTALVPSRNVAWHLAVQSCRARAARSVTTVLPFALSLSLVGLFIVMGNVMPNSTAGMGDVLVVLGWVFVVAWVGGLAVIALVGKERGRDSALISVAGAGPGVIAQSAILEGVIYAGTAIAFGALTLTITGFTIAAGARIDALSLFAGIPWIILGTLALATLVTTCLALAIQSALATRTIAVRALRT